MRADNRWKNLREATPKQNSQNRRPSKRNRSGRVGVCASRSRWRAFIGVNCESITLGYFDTFDEAVAARVKAESIHYGDFAPGAANAA